MAVAAKSKRFMTRPKSISPFMMARDNLVETLKGKRFALVGFDPEETQALRSAIDFASAQNAFDRRRPASSESHDADALRCLRGESFVRGCEGRGRRGRSACAQPQAHRDHRRARRGARPRVFACERYARIHHQAVDTRGLLPCARSWCLRNASSPFVDQPARGAGARTEPTIIVADDDRTTIMMVQSILRTWKINCRVAHNGKEALELTKELRPDALLLDVGHAGYGRISGPRGIARRPGHPQDADRDADRGAKRERDRARIRPRG